MEKSKHYSEILSLGKRIVEHLENDSRDVSLLSRWMAHHLAGLILEAESAEGSRKSELQRECVTLIVKIWEVKKRDHSSLHPINNLSGTVGVLNALTVNEPRMWHFSRLPREQDAWQKFAEQVERNSYSIFRELLRYTMASDLDDIELIDTEFELLLNPDENIVLEKLKQIVNKPNDNGVANAKYSELSADEKLKYTVEQLEKLIDRQKAALVELKNRVESKSS